MKYLYLTLIISLAFIACNEEMDTPIPATLTNANVTLYSYDCSENPADCLYSEEYRLGGVFHQLFDSEIAFIQGVVPIETSTSSTTGVSTWTQLAVQSYYLVSSYNALVIEQVITANQNTNSYINVAFE